MKVFRIDLLIPIKNALLPHLDNNVSTSIPARFEPLSRVPERFCGYFGDLKYMVGPTTDLDLSVLALPENSNSMLLSIRYSAFSPQDALTLVRSKVEAIFDNICFQIHQTLFPRCVDITDVSGVIAVNDVREFYSLKDPTSFFLPKYSNPTIGRGISFASNTPPSLEYISNVDDELQVAIWWYFKILQTNNLIDKSTFLFIILDIICKPYALLGPFIPKCGHVIEKCFCGESTMKQLPGESIKLKLLENGFSLEEVEFLWRARQLAHGIDFFSPNDLQSLSGLINKLHLFVFKQLENKLNIKVVNSPKGETHLFPSITNVDIESKLRQITKFDIEIEEALNNI